MTGLPGLKATRKAKGLTLSALARAVDLSSGYLWQVQSGLKDPSMDVLRRLCHRLECSPNELLEAASHD